MTKTTLAEAVSQHSLFGLLLKPLLLSIHVICCSAALCAEADSPDPKPEAINAAIRKSIPLLEQAAAGSTKHRQCFTCHGHAMPVLAVVEARRRGFTVDEENLQTQLKHTVADLARGKGSYLEGRGQGGGHMRAGYALWSLHAGDWQADEVTAAVSEYLVFDEDAEHWRSSSKRPPSELSPFAATYVALRGLDSFGTEKQADRIDARRDKALAWLIRSEPKETEDRVFRLLALNHLGAEKAAIKAAENQLVETQRDDGGWAQIADLDSDAYATGSALFALQQAADMLPSDDVYRRGVRFLLGSQLEDGSWQVRSRSKPFQTYYESGFPHGKDQFISMAASSWATLALLFACPTPPSAQQAVQVGGTWTLVKAEFAGQPIPGLKGATLLLSDGEKTFTLPDGKVEQGTYKTDPTKKPQHIDSTTEGRIETAKGIYDVDGDILKMCLSQSGKKRPTAFVTEEGTDLVLIVFKRTKKKRR